MVARNAQALHLIWAGGGHYGTNTLFLQAEDFLQLAQENPINYAIPSVTFVFFNGVTSAMGDALQVDSLCSKWYHFLWGHFLDD